MSRPTKPEVPWSRWHARLHKGLIRNHDLLPKGSSLLLSISGGQDSMALLKLIVDLRRLYEWKIFIWHGDHGWHKQSTQIATGLKEWCNNQELRFVSERATKEKIHSEQAARNWRYECLTAHAQLLSQQNQSSPCHYVLTGHTSTDRAETLLLNLSRGTHLSGLGSLKSSRTLSGQIKLVRPLLIFSREDTAQICKEMDLPVWLDPSNSNMRISRNRIREEVIPVLETLHPGSTRRIASLAERLGSLKDDQEALTILAIEAIKDSEGLSRQKVISLPRNTRRTVFAKWLKQSGVPALKASQLEDISHSTSARMAPGNRQLANGWIITWNRESIQLFNRHN
ncbi:tRNA lysidine(34) synthetase TilS [Prochlorococcus marinus]|uniref:tRNA(Ile)-lysidine synthase n=1 Tax=Prochlorococcus marinus (strain MIT 9211) TaxID=93059 RepID=A9BD95_PROM4|nr:tRNA lysidine(34) synthetase TilS [Prochlorococcus marinus]ABX09708.1 Predicted ATPase of the PP-loop superfamily implicated in cell cycle control [Prochlorococcus marinus str. MIT 9211]